MTEDLFDDINSFLEGEREKSPRDTYREIAKKQIDLLGYKPLLKDLANFFNGKGFMNEFQKAVPHIFGQDRDYIDHIVSMMKRIPSPQEAEELLMTALFGEPSETKKDGTVIITSFNIAEPSSITEQTQFAMLGDKKNNPLYITDVDGTDKLAGKVMSGSGFLEENKITDTMRDLRKSGQLSLPHYSNKFLQMRVERPSEFEKKSKSRTAYSYRIQTMLTPSS